MRIFVFILALVFAGASVADEFQFEKGVGCPDFSNSARLKKFGANLIVSEKVSQQNNLTESQANAKNKVLADDCNKMFEFAELRPSGFYRIFDHSNLSVIIGNTLKPVDEDNSLLIMDAFINWLRGFDFGGQQEKLESLINYIQSILPSGDLVLLLLKIVLMLSVLYVVFLIVRELYSSGLLRLPVISKQKNSIISVSSKTNHISWEMIAELPMRQQISALLQSSINMMVSERLMPGSTGYTNQELNAFLQKKDPQRANLFSSLIEISEPVIYGDQVVSQEMVITCHGLAKDVTNSA